ncbi:MAG: class I SAM-dependent methyltransferase [Phycisphaerales bacterium]|nr:class I SAM-dependent methyltransferase [Phycisphaerales bacterium]
MFTNYNPANVLHAFSRLLYPFTRDEALFRLKELGVLDEQNIARVREILSQGEYSYRMLFLSLGPVKVEMDEFLRGHDFIALRPRHAMIALEAYRAARPELFTAAGIAGKRVLDFGASDINPLAVAVVLVANGAESVIAYEPAGWALDYAKVSVRELIAEMHLSPETFTLPGGDPRQLKRRLAEIPFEKLGEGDTLEMGPITLTKQLSFEHYPSAFDAILSTSVFEHVWDVEKEIRHHASSLRPGGVSLNRIDFTDHRFFRADCQPFGFYRDGEQYGCNLLRVTDYGEVATKVGIGFEIKDAHLVDQSVVESMLELDRFKKYDMQTLRTASATLVLKQRQLSGSPA